MWPIPPNSGRMLRCTPQTSGPASPGFRVEVKVNDAALPEAPAWISPAVPVVKQPSDQGTYDPAHTKVWNNTLRITGSIFYLTYWKFHRIVTTVQYNVITSLRGLHVHCNS